MARVDIKGDIVINEYAEFYDWFGWECTCPSMVQNIFLYLINLYRMNQVS